jgi:phosphate transport system substrate-binding protein
MFARTLIGLGVAGALVGCQPATNPSGTGAAVTGAGATFPAPLYTRWATAYHAQTGITVNYQGIGSGAGIKQIMAKTVDFGASDKPLTPEALDQAGLYQFPTVVGGVTPIANEPGIGPATLRLTGEVLGDIYLGVVNHWDDPKIAALNPGLKLAHDPITVVHRSDGSGTTFLFTSYLSLVNPSWKAKVGANDAVVWPAGIGGKGNDGVAAFVKQTQGAIGYVEYAYAKQNHLAFTQLRNKDGAFVAPTADAFAAAAAGGDWAHAPGNNLLLLDQAGPTSWPITGATFILIYKQPPSPPVTKQVLTFFDWAYTHGDPDAVALDYVPLPQAVKDLMRGQWATTIKDASGQPVFKAAP